MDINKTITECDLNDTTLLLMMCGGFLITFLIAIWLWRQYLSNEDINFSMSKMGKTIAFYDIKHKTLYIPEAYADLHNLPKKIKNMPQGILDIMKDRIDDNSFQRLKSFAENVTSSPSIQNITKIRIPGRIDLKGLWIELESCTFFKKGKPRHAYICFEDLSIEYAHMLAFERFRMIDNSQANIGSDYSLLDATDDCVDISCGGLDDSSKYMAGMTIQEYHEENRGMRLYNKNGVSVMEFFSRENILKYYEEGKYVLEDIWNGASITGNQVWLIFSAKIVKDPYDTHIRCYLEHRDITDIKLGELKLRELSIRDGMTGLYNSKATRELVEQSLLRNVGERHLLAIFDLDGLKKVNDTFGHFEGDKIIKVFSKRLASAFDQESVVGRIGGDEFLMYVATPDVENLKSRIEDFIDSLSFNIGSDNDSVTVTCSVGVVLHEGSDYKYTDLYRRADAALYVAKQNGASKVVYYNNSYEIADDELLVVESNTDFDQANDAFANIFKRYMIGEEEMSVHFGSAPSDQQSIKSLNLLKYCISVDMRCSDAQLALKDIINVLCEHFGCDYSYIGSFHRSIEAVFADKNIVRCKPIPDSVIENLYNYRLANKLDNTLVFFDGCDENSSATYEYFMERNVKSLAIYPIAKDELYYGFIYLENPSQNLFSLTYINEISSVLASCFIRHLVKFHTVDNRFKDALTGVLNYEGFVKKSLETFELPDSKIYDFWCLSIKNYREILSKFDESVANNLVQCCADYIANDCPINEFFCRDYEGRFIGLTLHNEEKNVKDLNIRLKDALESTFKVRYGIDLTIETSCGVCHAVNNGLCNVEGTIAATIANQNRAKEIEGNNIAFSTHDTQKITSEDSLSENIAYAALLNNEFDVYFQPKLNIKHREPRIYAEALARWVRDGKIFAMPGEFLPIFKNTRKSTEFDLYIFEKVCSTIARWKAQGIDDIVISVNMSEETILAANIVDKFEELRKQYDVPSSSIEFEITEEVLFTNIDAVGAIVDRLHGCGYLCTLDDFGVERSTLYLLPQITFDAIKLDKRFFKSHVNVSRQKLVLSHLIELVSELGMVLISEGVEKQEEVDFLKHNGCEYIQGYYHAHPMNEVDFVGYILDYRSEGLED